MTMAWGLAVLVLSLLAWLGQIIAWRWPETAVRLSLREADADLEPVYGVDVKGEAIWDVLILWTLPLAAVLLILDEPTWALFGLLGGGVYLYYAGRGIITRALMQERGFRIGSTQNVRLGYLFLGLWGAMAIVTIAIAAASFPGLW